jgi:hypothetical protein
MTWTLSTYRRLRALLVASRPRSAFAAVLLASFIALGSNVATGGSQPLPAPAQQRETDHPDQANAHETVWLGFTLTDIAGEAAPRLLLSGKDADLYRSALQAQRNKNWLQADRALSRIKDRRLVGTVLAQRYLAKDYKTSYAELKAWLQNYADPAGEPSACTCWPATAAHKACAKPCQRRAPPKGFGAALRLRQSRAATIQFTGLPACWPGASTTTKRL